MLGIVDQHGTIEKSKYPDHILLCNNPPEDMRKILSIEEIFEGGKLQPRIAGKPAGRLNNIQINLSSGFDCNFK